MIASLMRSFDRLTETYLTWILVGSLLVILYLSCFVLAPQIGLYADDYNSSSYWGLGVDEMLSLVKQNFIAWPLGRPLLGVQKAVVGESAWLLGGLRGAHILGYLVLAGNALLTFVILRLVAPLSVAFVGALMMIVYPGDASKMIYVRTVQVQFVILVFLFSTWLYLTGHRIWSYILIFWTIGVYETVILPFLLVPGLQVPWKRGLAREQIRHGAAVAVLLMGAIVLRMTFGSGFTKAGQLWEAGPLLLRSAQAVMLGTMTSAELLFLRLLTALQQITWVSGVVMAFVAVLIYFLLTLVLSGDRKGKPLEKGNCSYHRGGAHPLKWPPYIQMISVGAGMWLLAYPFFVTAARFPPTAKFGRISSPHAAAEIGVSLVAAGLFWMVLSFLHEARLRRFASGLAALYFGLLAGFQVTVQTELAKVWRQQTSMWQAILIAAPDLEPDTLIVVNPTNGGWYRSRYGEVFPWNFQFILPQIVKMNRDVSPKAIWAWQLRSDQAFSPKIKPDNNIEITLFQEPTSRKNMNGNVIWLEADGLHHFKRMTGTKIIQGVSIKLKQPGPSTQGRWMKGPLYEPMLGN